jgi:thiol-disulfide isomerase/thioredoxin
MKYRRRHFGWMILGTTLAVFTSTISAQVLKPWTGGAAPALELADLDGAMHRLSEYRGKTVLVNFWATWCEPCRAEMPSIERLRKAMEGKAFAVLAVNVGESGRVARDYAEKLPVNFAVLLDRDGRATRSWGARILPASYVIGPDGAIRYSYLGELDWSGSDVRARIEALMPKQPERAAATPTTHTEAPAARTALR